mmetsp:Transcript_84240/g.146289  ORF Transcript_84240/g.146289 Transcript_84240/m.146289 type:complete len:101 (-) Transcript_84240:320-622(-)
MRRAKPMPLLSGKKIVSGFTCCFRRNLASQFQRPVRGFNSGRLAIETRDNRFSLDGLETVGLARRQHNRATSPERFAVVTATGRGLCARLPRQHNRAISP